MEMDDTLRAELVAALRSGEYAQGSGFLRTRDNKFCCLGVLCDLLAKRGLGQWVEPIGGLSEERSGYEFYYLGAQSNTCLPRSLESLLPRQAYDGKRIDQAGLAGRNDEGWSFESIAAAIEAGTLPPIEPKKGFL